MALLFTDFELIIAKFNSCHEKKINQSKIKGYANTINKHAVTCGISSVHITDVLKLATSGKFSANVSTTLLRSLIPSESVPEEAVLCGIARITSGKCPLRIQEILLEWIVSVFDLINSKSSIHALYGALFNLLDYETLCPILCHLLFLLTRPQDVTHFRIARILLLAKRVGSLPHINALLSVYRLNQPSLIMISHGQKAYFKKKNNCWTIKSDCPTLPQKRRYTEVGNNSSIVPVAQPRILLNAYSIETFKLARLPEISDKKSIEEVVAKLDKINLPRQAASLLSERHFQHILSIIPEPSIRIRLHFWLHERLYLNFFEKDCDLVQQSELLKILLVQKELFKMDLDISQSFLYPYLETWNGHTHTELVLKLISSLPIFPFNVLNENVLSVLKKLFLLERNVRLRCRIINTLTILCCNSFVKRKNDLTVSDNILDWKEATEKTIKFVDNLLVLGISLHPNDVCLLNSGLEFWKSVADMLYRNKSDILILPHFLIIYKGLFSCSNVCVINVCSTILILLKICIGIKQKKTHRVRDVLETFNLYIADIHDTLWRHRAFHPFCNPKSIAFNQLDLKVVKENCLMKNEIQVTSSFAVDRHPALITCTLLFCRAHVVPLEKTLTSELLFEPEYMKFLKSEGLLDILKLLQELTDL